MALENFVFSGIVDLRCGRASVQMPGSRSKSRGVRTAYGHQSRLRERLPPYASATRFFFSISAACQPSPRMRGIATLTEKRSNSSSRAFPRIATPRPHGRGNFIPHLLFAFDSNSAFRLEAFSCWPISRRLFNSNVHPTTRPSILLFLSFHLSRSGLSEATLKTQTHEYFSIHSVRITPTDREPAFLVS